MSSQRKLIRHAVVDRLKCKTACEERVYPNRVLNLFEIELPAILVYMKNEPSKVYQAAPVEYERDLQLVVEVVVNGDDTLDDLIDDISDDIEYWLHQDHTQGELCSDTILKNTQIEISNQGDKLIGSAVLTYSMPYYTEAVRDSKDLRVLARANAKWYLPGDDAASGLKAEDEINAVTGDA